MKASELASELIKIVARGVDRDVLIVLKDGTWGPLQSVTPSFTEAGNLVLLLWTK